MNNNILNVKILQRHLCTSSTSNTPTSNLRPTPCTDTCSEQKPNKPKDSKPSTPHVDLTGKLDSQGKLTQQERQHWIDKNLCLFCRGSRHQTDNCLVKSMKGHAATMESIPTLSKLKESGVEPKKDWAIHRNQHSCWIVVTPVLRWLQSWMQSYHPSLKLYLFLLFLYIF